MNEENQKKKPQKIRQAKTKDGETEERNEGTKERRLQGMWYGHRAWDMGLWVEVRWATFTASTCFKPPTKRQ